MTQHLVRAWAVCLVLAVTAAGQTPVGPSFQVNTYTTGNEGPPSIAVEPDGDFVIVWSSAHDGDALGVFGQRFDAWSDTPGPR